MTAPASCVPGVVWPGIPTSVGAALLALQWQLARSERWTPERLRAHQFAQIQRLAAYAVLHASFYRDSLQHAGVASAAELTPEAFARWPLLKPSDVQNSYAGLIAPGPAGHGSLEERFTTGSTAAPKRILGTQALSRMHAALVMRDHLWQRRDFSAKFGAIRAFQKRASQSGWSLSTNAAFPTGPSVVLGIDTPVKEQLAWLLVEEPAYLLTAPSNLKALLDESRSSNRRPSRLRQVLTYSEALEAGLRQDLERTWGVPLADTYSSTEAGPIALQCPGRTSYHVQAESVYVEVLRQDDSPCQPGELGRLVITIMHNFAMPLIRYDVGDYAVSGSSCPCGRGLQVLERVVGRARNMARDPKGRVFQPGFDRILQAANLPVRQFRFVQETPEVIEMSYVADRALSVSEMDRFRHAAWEQLPYPFTIRFRRVAEIARPPGGKYEGFISKVA